MIEKATTQIDKYYDLLEKTDSNVVWEILRQSETFYEWGHYPDGDVYDRSTHSQYYYHAHANEDGTRWDEHGHFHLFIRQKGIPATFQPKPLLPIQQGEDTDELCHLCGISMNEFGKPVRLFTTNRWVTGETWYTADVVANLLPLFNISHTWPSWPTNLWLTEFVKQYRTEIQSLAYERDRVVAQWQNQHPDKNVYEDRSLEVTSYLTL